MSKKGRPVPKRALTKGQLSRWQRERRVRRILIGIAVFVVVVIAALIGSGYYLTSVRPLHQVVLRVNDTSFSMAQFLDRLRYEVRDQNMMRQYLGMPPLTAPDSQLARSVLDSMESDQVIRDKAAQFGLEVSPGEVEEEIRNLFGFGLTSSETPGGEERTPQEEEEAFQERYRQYLKDTGLSPEELQRSVATEMLRLKLREYVTEELDPVPTSAPQVHLWGLKVTSEDLEEVQAKLAEEGADPQELVADYSQDAASKAQNGDLGWLPRGLRETAFDEAAFSLEPGVLSDPIEVGGGHWFLKVLEKEEDRELDEDTREILKSQAFGEWMEQEMARLKEEGRVVDYLTPERLEWALKRASE